MPMSWLTVSIALVVIDLTFISSKPTRKRDLGVKLGVDDYLAELATFCHVIPPRLIVSIYRSYQRGNKAQTSHITSACKKSLIRPAMKSLL